MPIKLKSLIALLPLAMTAFMPQNEPQERTESYYRLRLLKNAAPPREMRIARIDARQRKTSIETGVLISYKNREARQVRIAGDFTLWRPVNMERGNFGIWYYLVTAFEGGNDQRYKLMVDGIWTRDPMNAERQDDGAGSYVSIISPVLSPDGPQVSYRFIGKNTVEFRVYRPKARLVSLVGDFNHWNPENDLMEKGPDGVWRLKKRLSGGTYRYTYIIDGRWSLDLYNESSATDDSGTLCSMLTVR
jgi:hypothetical protein